MKRGSDSASSRANSLADRPASSCFTAAMIFAVLRLLHLKSPFSFDPKPENETAGNLSPAAGCGPLNAGSRRTKNAEKGSQRREDRFCLAASGGRQEACRRLPRDGS